MAKYRIKFNEINSSAQVGDLLYYMHIDNDTEPKLIGRIIDIERGGIGFDLRVQTEDNVNTGTIDTPVYTDIEADFLALAGIANDTDFENPLADPGPGLLSYSLQTPNPDFPLDKVFFMFMKNEIANISSVKGYFAKAKMETSNTNKTKLFAVGSEIIASSK